jgi:hypothetical protein
MLLCLRCSMKLSRQADSGLVTPNCAVRRGLGRGREALGLVSSSFGGLPILLRTASRTLARPFACILFFSASMMLMTSGALPLCRNLDLRCYLRELGHTPAEAAAMASKYDLHQWHDD